MNVGFRDLAAR